MRREPCFEREVGLDDPETSSNINFSVILCLDLVRARDVSPCRITGFGGPVTSEIDHLSGKANAAVCNAYNRNESSKAVSNLHIFFVLA